jgi:hypothetical protein
VREDTTHVSIRLYESDKRNSRDGTSQTGHPSAKKEGKAWH